ncbi:unnamed protein product [Triticum turgidum subsp. durum]|uniref:Uncharacterized protein n=1 Tax=Triticum turgidum subsp. durum TaxID=4567 RepID=A0A9R0RRT7_TRITD|nr:unnamed protein product [Triticum turgidum subsp. durum]
MCGDGSFGQLGTGDTQSRNLPFEVPSFTTKHVEKLAFGMRHSLVLLKDNSVYGFGSARRGQVGKSASKNQKFCNTPRLIDGFPNCKIVNLYANGDHSAAFDGKHCRPAVTNSFLFDTWPNNFPFIEYNRIWPVVHLGKSISW